MGHSREDKAKSHQRIVEIASTRMRESGTEAPGVAELMREAGLTHGGFYKHFASRDDLVAEAVQSALDLSAQRFVDVTTDVADPLAAFAEMYTSEQHRDNPGDGCGVVALASDVSRGDERVRGAYTERVRGYIAGLEGLIAGETEDGDGEVAAEVRRRAVLSFSALVGAVLVARAVDDEQLSAEILGDVRTAVGAQSMTA
jgi:TetR/AcrR family transcriptional repressor of nem operon